MERRKVWREGARVGEGWRSLEGGRGWREGRKETVRWREGEKNEVRVENCVKEGRRGVWREGEKEKKEGEAYEWRAREKKMEDG